jgi:branched-chain amino acid aminotransferase
MSLVNYNGKTLPSTADLINPSNRGFRYGDGLFETMKFKNGHVILIDEHLSRLWTGMKAMKFQIPKLFHPDKIETEILDLVHRNKLNSARIRITVFRSDGGLFDPENHIPNYLIQLYPLSENSGQWNENGLELCLYKEAIKSIDNFCNIKHNNFLPYLMGAIYAKENKCNDALITNHFGNICESTIANVFAIKNDVIITPPLSEGCIAGIMRNFVIQFLKTQQYPISENPITSDTILEADEIFLTNSIYNMRWVAGLESKKYRCTITQKIFHALRETNPEIIC